jgi:hypothetical protein
MVVPAILEVEKDFNSALMMEKLGELICLEISGV